MKIIWSITFLFSFCLQIQYNVFELEYSYQTKALYKLEPYFSNVKNQLSSLISVSPFTRDKIITINTPICTKLFKSYNIPLSIDF